MARGIDSGWVRVIINVVSLAFAMLAGVAGTAAAFNGRMVKNEADIEHLTKTVGKLEDEVHDIWLVVVKNEKVDPNANAGSARRR